MLRAVRHALSAGAAAAPGPAPSTLAHVRRAPHLSDRLHPGPNCSAHRPLSSPGPCACRAPQLAALHLAELDPAQRAQVVCGMPRLLQLDVDSVLLPLLEYLQVGFIIVIIDL